MDVVLAGDREVMLQVFVGRSDGIVNGDDNRESPCQEGQDLVGYDSGRVMRVPLRKGVSWGSSISISYSKDPMTAARSNIAYSG